MTLVAAVERETRGAAMKEDSGSTWTGIQRPGSSNIATAGELGTRSGGTRSRPGADWPAPIYSIQVHVH